MKKIVVPFFLLFLISCKNAEVAPDNKPNLKALTATEQVLSSANNDFAFDLFRAVQSKSANDNAFISPLSVTMALAMTMNGASESTQQSILHVIEFGNSTPMEVNEACKDLTSILTSMDRTVQLGIANSVWNNQHYEVRDTFASIIKNYFNGSVQGLDFADPNSVNVINSWVESRTNNLIKNILDQTKEDDAMFLINAIYFKGSWTTQFDKEQTHSAPFFQEDGSSQSASTMFSKATTLGFFANQNFKLIDIPYGNKQFSMTVLMPSENYSVDELTKNLTSDSLASWLSKSYELAPQLELPKFKVGWKKDLKEDLISLGMQPGGFPLLFQENLSLEITKVIHQSFIDVNEEGTEAAAATVTGIGVTSVGPGTKIQINRPFIYLIREKHTNAILFIGQMYSPQ